MNMFVVIGAAAPKIALDVATFGDACALCLFVSGLVSLSIAGYLLCKTPKFDPARFRR